MSTDETLDNLKEKTRKLLMLQEVSLTLGGELHLGRCLEKIMDAVVSITGAERGFLMLKVDEKFRMEVARNLDRDNIARSEFKVSHSVAMAAVETGRPVFTTNAQADQRFRSAKSVTTMRLLSICCLPLKARGVTIGVIYLDNRFQRGVFREEDAAILEAFAASAAMAIENARLYQREMERRREVEVLNRQLSDANESLTSRAEGRAGRADAARAPAGGEPAGEGQDETEEARSGGRGDAPRFPEIVGRSPGVTRVVQELETMIGSDLPVLITGENGTGKELVARVLHAQGARREKPFVAENCAAFPESLLESELFGHVKGAFTGAERDRAGILEVADGGTLFLDEVGDMGAQMQARLLRFLQDGVIRRVGAKDYRRVDVRLITATNKDLRALIREGRFRKDLFYRIKVFAVALPPLRDRVEDIPLLCEYFLTKAAGGKAPKLRKDALSCLARYAWPGNIRELANEMRRLAAIGRASVGPEDLSPEIVEPAGDRHGGDETGEGSYFEALRQFETDLFTRAMEKSGWNLSEAARSLGIQRMKLARGLQKHGISRAHRKPDGP